MTSDYSDGEALPGDENPDVSGLEQFLADRRKNEALRYVELNAATRRYANAWCHPDVRTVLFIAPNAVGKTYATVTFMGWTIWPETAPDWFRILTVSKFGGFPKAIRLCSTAQEVSESGSLQLAIKKLWPKGRYTSEKMRKPFPSQFKTDTGWTMDVMTYDQSKDEFEGGDRGLVVFNEPPPEEIYTACIARTRMGGLMVFPGTPLYNSAWIKDKLVDKAHGDKTMAVIGGDIEEACKDHSPGGHLKHTEIVRLMSSYDMDEYDARVKGKFMHLSGVIYRTFGPQFVAQKTLPRDPNGLAFMVIDPAGFNKPYAIIWGQVVTAPMNGIRILAEWPDGSAGPQSFFENMKEPGMKLEDYVGLIGRIEDRLGFKKEKVHRILDRRFGHNRDITSGLSLRERFDDYGFYFSDSYNVPEKQPEVATGVMAVKNYLKLDADTKQPFIHLDPSCVNTRRAFERWSVDPNTQKPKDDVWKNFMDVVRYACAANMTVDMAESDATWNEVKVPQWGMRA